MEVIRHLVRMDSKMFKNKFKKMKDFKEMFDNPDYVTILDMTSNILKIALDSAESGRFIRVISSNESIIEILVSLNSKDGFSIRQKEYFNDSFIRNLEKIKKVTNLVQSEIDYIDSVISEVQSKYK